MSTPSCHPAALARPPASRAALLALGTSARSWPFLADALPYLNHHPDDDGVRLLVLSHAVRLGSGSLARAMLAALRPQVRSLAEVDALARAAASLAGDHLAPDARRTLLRRNLDALSERLSGPSDASDWTAQPLGDLHTLSEGRVLDALCVPPVDEADEAEQLLAEHRSHWKTTPGDVLVIDSLSCPLAMVRALEARPRQALGHLPRVLIVEPDLARAARALSRTDLSAMLSAGHVHLFAGPGACDRFEAFVRSRPDDAWQGTMVRAPGRSSSDRAASEDPAAALARALDAQRAEVRRLRERVESIYAARSPAWWASRYAEPRPLRVLIPTSRYSTFVQHSAADLAATIRALGHEPRVLIEPDDHTCFSSAAYLRCFAEFEPDLVVIINFPRALLKDAAPANVPWICWVQDQMPHLFSPVVGASQGPLDFLVGNVLDVLFDRHGYPRERTARFRVPASETKFHAQPASPAQRERFACDLAYVSHQSEHPEAQHRRLVDQLPRESGLREMVDALRPTIEHLATTVEPRYRHTDLRGLVEAAVLAHPRARAGAADPTLVDTLTRAYAEPYADRVLRHQTLAWASEICRRRGWSLRLFGSGWEHHPTLAAHAAGPLAHGDDLRLCYQSAGAQLHMSFHTLSHPRLAECVLAGGLPLCRLNQVERDDIVTWFGRLAVREGLRAEDNRTHDPFRRVAWASSPSQMRFASALQRMEAMSAFFEPDPNATRHRVPDLDETDIPNPFHESLWGPVYHAGELRRDPREPVPPPVEASAFAMLGAQPELLFHSPETLEHRLETLLADATQRRELSRLARQTVLEHATYASVAQRMLGLVRRELSHSQSPKARSAVA